MAGQPLKRACHLELDRHEEEIFERLSCGAFVTDLCRLYLADPYEEAGKDEPNNYHFYSWLDEAEGRRDRFDRVREGAADSVAEESIRILDEAREEGVSSTAEASIVKAQANSRQWWASKLNRDKYGEGKQEVDVNVSLGELHLDALRAAGSMEQVESGEPDAIEAVEGRDYEIEESRDDTPGDEDPGGRTLGKAPNS